MKKNWRSSTASSPGWSTSARAARRRGGQAARRPGGEAARRRGGEAARRACVPRRMPSFRDRGRGPPRGSAPVFPRMAADPRANIPHPVILSRSERSPREAPAAQQPLDSLPESRLGPASVPSATRYDSMHPAEDRQVLGHIPVPSRDQRLLRSRRFARGFLAGGLGMTTGWRGTHARLTACPLPPAPCLLPLAA